MKRPDKASLPLVIDPARLFLNEDCGDGHFPALVKTQMCRVNNGII
jgi:hypothetical protein